MFYYIIYGVLDNYLINGAVRYYSMLVKTRITLQDNAYILEIYLSNLISNSELDNRLPELMTESKHHRKYLYKLSNLLHRTINPLKKQKISKILMSK